MRRLLREMKADPKRRTGVLLWLTGSVVIGITASVHVGGSAPIWAWVTGVLLAVVGLVIDPKHGDA